MPLVLLRVECAEFRLDSEPQGSKFPERKRLYLENKTDTQSKQVALVALSQFPIASFNLACLHCMGARDANLSITKPFPKDVVFSSEDIPILLESIDP